MRKQHNTGCNEKGFYVHNRKIHECQLKELLCRRETEK